MIEQKVAHRSMAGWRGVALIAVIAAGVVALSSLFSALEPVLGSLWASLLFILCGMLAAGLLMNTYVLGYVYRCDGKCLRVSRVYGKRERPMAELWLNGALACGSCEDMKRRFPGARAYRATKRDCPLPTFALACREGDRTALMVMQPEAELREAIVRAVKK